MMTARRFLLLNNRGLTLHRAEYNRAKNTDLCMQSE